MQKASSIAPLVIFASLLSGGLFAEETSKTSGPIVFSGFIDASYNELVQSNLFTSQVYNRVYDLNENGFTLQQAAGTASYLPDEGLGFLLNAMVGRDAITSNAYGMGTWIQSKDFGVDATQGYLRLSHSKISFDAGKFTTLNGVETIAPITDSDFSRSILFGYAGPFTAAGARATYTANSNLKFVFGLNDGWDTVRDPTRGQTFEFNSTIVFNPVFTLASTVYTGKQRATDRTSYGPIGSRTLFDFVGTITANEKLSFNLNYDYAWQTVSTLGEDLVGRANWSGVAGYINYKITDLWRTTVRGEVFDDQQGYRTGVVQTWKELTLTLAYTPYFDKSLELRAETRRDFSNTASFLNKNSDGSKNFQQSFALEALYHFG